MSLNLSEDEIVLVHEFLIDLLKPIYEDNDESLTAMADYCVILIKTHSDDVDTLTEFARSQLFDFLAENTDNFVAQLMNGLLTRAYIKSTHAPTQPVPTSVMNRIQIRPQTSSPPPAPHTSLPQPSSSNLPPRPHSVQQQRPLQPDPIQWTGTNQQQQPSSSHNTKNQNENLNNGSNQRSNAQQQQLRVCFSFRDKGYCNRQNCHFEHIPSTLANRLGSGPSQQFTPPTNPATNATTPHNRPSNDPHKTLVVSCIPDEHCKRFVLESWFSRFGAVERIEVKAPERKAFVTFTSLDHAKAAVESPLAVLDNRFICIAYYNKRYTSPQAHHHHTPPASVVPPAVGYPPYTSFGYWYPPPPEMAQPYYPPEMYIEPAGPEPLTEAEAADRVKKREADLVKIASMVQLVQQKMGVGEAAADLHEMLNTLQKQAMDIKVNLVSNPATAAYVPQYVKEVRVANQKAALDAELEVLARLRTSAQPVDSDDDGLDIDVGSEVSSSCKTPTAVHPVSNGSATAGSGAVPAPSPFGASYAWRPQQSGAGGFASFSKDFRPTTVVVGGITDEAQVPGVVHALTTKYGEVDQHVVEAGSLSVKFAVRLSAERAVAGGIAVDGIGVLSIAWK